MSIQAVAAVLEADIRQVAAKMLLVCIANAHNTSTGLCCPSIERLAAESGLTRRSVHKWLDWCVDHHFLAIETRFDTNGRQLANTYALTIGEGAKFAPSPVQTVAPPGVQTVAPLEEPEEEPEESVSSASGRVRDPTAELCEVLDEQHAEALIAHFNGLGEALTGYTARLKAQQLDQFPDPNTASEEMILSGWRNLKAAWAPHLANATPKAAGEEVPRRTAPLVIVDVDQAAEPDLVIECEELLGHFDYQPGKGVRRYVRSIVDRATANLANKAPDKRFAAGTISA